VSLRQKIEQEIRERGPIPFSRYMEMCLYHPQLGYYSRNAEQFGKAGDFYTSSDVHAVFGRLLARQFEEMWRVLDSPEQIEIRELGPGRGLFAQDVLDWSEKKFPEFFGALHYSLVESSPALRQKLQSTLSRHLASGKVSLARGWEYAAAHSSSDRPVIVFANEFFDALPVEVVSSQGSLRIGVEDHHFIETWAPASPEELSFLDRYSVHPQDGECVEVSLRAQTYLGEIAAHIQQGFFVAIDYGYTRDEQIAGRHRGTVTAFRQHSMSATPYDAPGEQDITVHVNFTVLRDAAERSGMRVEPLLTQSQFLLGIGEPNQFADAFEECKLPQEHAKVALQLKHLVTPAGMGEHFRVMLASTAVAEEQISRLSGLSFASPIRSRH
jgi:SAM-dependent MidA family methyltransferase